MCDREREIYIERETEKSVTHRTLEHLKVRRLAAGDL